MRRSGGDDVDGRALADLAGVGGLRLGDGDGGDAAAAGAREVAGEVAPAAADVGDVIAGLDVELLGDQLELGGLRGVESSARRQYAHEYAIVGPSRRSSKPLPTS